MGRKGTKSRTHFGRKNYTTKRGDKVYHYKGHYVKKTHRPYSYSKGSSSRTNLGLLDYTTKLGDLVFHQKKHYVKKSRRPYSTKSRKTRRM
jgi:hypothetical protein